jgi:diacylglycerol kinase (ATP)
MQFYFKNMYIKITGVTSHGLSCEVCKAKVHKRCAIKTLNNCKWTTLASLGPDINEDKEGVRFTTLK